MNEEPTPPSDLGETLKQPSQSLAESKSFSQRPHPAQHPEAPAIPGYVLLEPLGSGAYARVWRAKQLRTQKTVAVKVFTRKSGVDWLLLQQEVQRLIRLDKHPHVISLLDADLATEIPFYAMELMEGGSLDSRVDPLHPVPANDAARWMEEIAQSLAFVHGKGIIHCDLKPANILLDGEGRIRVADFGQSRFMTDSAGALGTLFYMAPEQVETTAVGSRAQPDQRWDVYALGATVHALLTGQAPHGGKENRDRLKAAATVTERLRLYAEMARCEPPSGWTDCAGTPVDEELAALADRCLSFDPAARPASVSHILADLQARRENRPISSLAHRRSYVFSKFLRRTISSAGISALLGSAALALLLGAALFRGLLISVEKDEMAHDEMDAVENLSPELLRGLDQDPALLTIEEFDIMQRLLRDGRVADLAYFNRDGSVRWHADPSFLGAGWKQYARGADSPKTDAVFQAVRARASRARRDYGNRYWEIAIPLTSHGSPPAVVALVLSGDAVYPRVAAHMSKYWLSALGAFFLAGLALVFYLRDLRGSLMMILGSGGLLLLAAFTIFLFRVKPSDERPEPPDVKSRWAADRDGVEAYGADSLPAWPSPRKVSNSAARELGRKALAHYQRGDLAEARAEWLKAKASDPLDPAWNAWLARVAHLSPLKK